MRRKFLEVIVLKTYAKYSKIIGSVINQTTKENKISVKECKIVVEDE